MLLDDARAVEGPPAGLGLADPRQRRPVHLARDDEPVLREADSGNAAHALPSVVVGMGAGHAFIGSVYVVEGTSMDPAYPAGTELYGAPISTPVERGDVVLLDDGNIELEVVWASGGEVATRVALIAVRVSGAELMGWLMSGWSACSTL